MNQLVPTDKSGKLSNVNKYNGPNIGTGTTQQGNASTTVTYDKKGIKERIRHYNESKTKTLPIIEISDKVKNFDIYVGDPCYTFVTDMEKETRVFSTLNGIDLSKYQTSQSLLNDIRFVGICTGEHHSIKDSGNSIAIITIGTTNVLNTGGKFIGNGELVKFALPYEWDNIGDDGYLSLIGEGKKGRVTMKMVVCNDTDKNLKIRNAVKRISAKEYIEIDNKFTTAGGSVGIGGTADYSTHGESIIDCTKIILKYYNDDMKQVIGRSMGDYKSLDVMSIDVGSRL
jgi:hypothetical protein